MIRYKITKNVYRKIVSDSVRKSIIASLKKQAVPIDNIEKNVEDFVFLGNNKYMISEIEDAGNVYKVYLWTEKAEEAGYIEVRKDHYGVIANTSKGNVIEMGSGLELISFPEYRITIKKEEEYTIPAGTFKVIFISKESNMLNIIASHELKPKQISSKSLAQSLNLVRDKMLREHGVSKLDLSGPNRSFTLGYLASKGKVVVRIKDEQRKSFEALYKELTGEKAPEPVEGSYYTIIAPEKLSWEYYHIWFPKPNESLKKYMDFGGGTTQWNWQGGAKNVGKDWTLNLLSMGFKLGKHHDIDRIREFVTDREAFDKGLKYDPKKEEKERTELPEEQKEEQT